MAHEIENEQIAYAGETPWHGIGAKLDPTATPAEFLKAAKLDWSIDSVPVYAHTDQGAIEIPNKRAFLRSTDHKVMTLASSAWKPFQNAYVVDFMKRYCDAGGATMETVGALRDGQVVWALARINHDFEVRKGDRVNGYILITSPHQVGQSIQVRSTTVRVVCANTMAMADRASNLEYRQSHLSDFDVALAKESIERSHEALAAAERRCKTLDKLKINLNDAMEKVIVPVFESQFIADPELMNLIQGPDGRDFWTPRMNAIADSIKSAPGAIENNGWGVLNGVTHYCDHVAGHNPSSRLYSSWLGDHRKKKLAVEERLLELAH